MVNEASGISDKIDWVVAKGKSVYYFSELDGSVEYVLDRVTESGEPGSPLNDKQLRQLELNDLKN